MRLFAHRWHSTRLCDCVSVKPEWTRFRQFTERSSLDSVSCLTPNFFVLSASLNRSNFLVTVVIISVHHSLFLTRELVYGHRTVATIAPGIETLDWSRNKQWNDTHLDSDAVQPITIHTQIETVDSNKPIRRRHDPRHEWHLKGNKQRYNDKYNTVKYCCHQMTALVW